MIGTENPVVEVSSQREPESSGMESDARDDIPKTLSIVTRTAPLTSILRAIPSFGQLSNSACEMLLGEIENGVRNSTRWPDFCLRLLRILKEEFLRLNFYVAAAQIDRIEATEERDADRPGICCGISRPNIG